jgi:hypothetical protein
MSGDPYYNSRYRRLLELGPFERCVRGWRFGTKIITDRTVDRLIAAGYARRDGDRVLMAERRAAE